MTESIFLLGLGACWVGYLGWYWRDNRRTASPRRDGIRSFAAGLGTLGGSAAPSRTLREIQPVLTPRSADDASRRRRDVLVALGAICVVTLVAALAFGPLALVLHLLADTATIVYGSAVIQRRNRAAEREIKVHMLYPERQAQRGTPVRRVVNG